MYISDLYFKVLSRLTKIFRHYIRKPFIGNLGKGSVIRSGVKLIGNPYHIKIGTNTNIWQNAVLAVGVGEIKIGDNCSISVGTFLNATKGKIIIGDRVGIAAYSKIYSFSTGFTSSETWKDSYHVADIIIEDDVVIGAGVVILPGVTIGRNAIIAAGAVVNKSVKPYTWYLKDGTQWHPDR